MPDPVQRHAHPAITVDLDRRIGEAMETGAFMECDGMPKRCTRSLSKRNERLEAAARVGYSREPRNAKNGFPSSPP